MDILNESKKVWKFIRSPKAIAAFKFAAAVMSVGVAAEALIKSLRDKKKDE